MCLIVYKGIGLSIYVFMCLCAKCSLASARARNDAGHPTGKELDKDILKVNLTSFQRYLESIYGIKNVFDILAS
jgi:hypothetical protein